MTGFIAMDKPQEITGAHSAIEAYLRLLITPCSTCSHGAREPVVERDSGEDGVLMVTTCGNCGATDAFAVRNVRMGAGVDPVSLADPINPTRQPSAIIDVAQWLTASELLVQSARATPDAQEARWRRCRAGECLDEALKFYGPESELPPESAFWTDASRAALREHPQRFARERVIAMRDDLPRASERTRAAETEKTAGKRPWWRRR